MTLPVWPGRNHKEEAGGYDSYGERLKPQLIKNFMLRFVSVLSKDR